MIKRVKLSPSEKTEARRVIREKVGYAIKSTNILNQIFRRSSFTAETGRSSNEMFEFIGDQALSFYLTKVISQRGGVLSHTGDYVFCVEEGQLTQIKQSLVNNQTLAGIMNEWGLAKYLLVGECDRKNDVIHEPKVKADLLEAIIGGIAMDCALDDAVLESVVEKLFGLEEKMNVILQGATPNITIDNAVTVLKELAERSQCTMPTYEIREVGYDTNGNPLWACTCTTITKETGLRKCVFASSKKEAKKAAAYLILRDHFNLPNLYGINKRLPVWIYRDGQLIPDHLKEEEQA